MHVVCCLLWLLIWLIEINILFLSGAFLGVGVGGGGLCGGCFGVVTVLALVACAPPTMPALRRLALDSADDMQSSTFGDLCCLPVGCFDNGLAA